MRLDSRSGMRGVFVSDVDGRVVRWVIWYDTETGDYEAFRSDPEIAKRFGVEPGRLRYTGRERLRFIPATPARKPKPTDPVDAAGSLREAKLLWSKPIIILPGQECDERFCHRLATWRTAVERVIEAVVGDDGKAYKRSIVVETHQWCDRHYRLPTRTSVRGVESETEVEVRPQW